MHLIRTISALAGLTLIFAAGAHAIDMDWDYCNETWFISRKMASPWAAASEGVQVNTPGCHEIQKDWELYDRMLDPTDGLSPSIPDAADSYPVPGFRPNTKDGSLWFSLYNRKTGQLRVFLFIQKELDSKGQKQSMSLQVTNGNGSTPYTKHGFFAYEGPGALYLQSDRTNSSQDLPQYQIPMTKQEKWVIADTYLSYEPTRFSGVYPSDFMYFNYQFKTFATQELTVTGNLTVQDQPSSSMDIFSTAKNFSNGLFKGFTETSQMPVDASKSLESTGKWLTDKGKTSEAAKFFSLAKTTAGITSNLGLGMGGASIISSFISIGQDSRQSYPNYSVNLKGLITQVDFPDNVKMPVASSASALNQKNYFSKRYTNKDELDLGLVSLTSTPTFNTVFVPKLGWWVMGSEYRLFYDAYINVNDIYSKLAVNPASGAKIRDVRVWIDAPYLSGTGLYPSTMGAQSLPAPPAVTMHTRWTDTKVSNSQFAGRLSYHYSGEGQHISHTVIDTYAPKRPTVPAGLPIKLYIKLESSPGVFQEIVKQTVMQSTAAIHEPKPLQNNPGGGKTTIVQGTLTAANANRRTTVAIVDPILPVFSPSGSYMIGQPYYAGRANWYVRPVGPEEIGSRPYAVSGFVGHNATTSVQFQFTGDLLMWDWKVSSESGWDYLTIYVDGTEHGRISGEGPWAQKWVFLPWGNHTAEFRYSKDGSYARGEDRGYVANVYGGAM